jgi:cell division protein FtsQ
MKNIFFIISDIIIGLYLVLAITSWNKPAPVVKDCQKVTIRIADENTHGFLTKSEIQRLLKQRGLYPLGQPIAATNPRKIEMELKRMPFVSDAQCSVTQHGHVYITVMQRTPLIRIKNILNQDFYIDDNGGIMPNSQYVSNLMIATGYINKAYATKYISVIAHFLMEDELWCKEIEQINITKDKQVELIPRNGNHVVNIGKMPQINDADPPSKKYVAINDHLKRQLTRLELFYRYVPQTLEPPVPNDTTNTLNSQTYDYIDLEYNNQIICQRRTSL